MEVRVSKLANKQLAKAPVSMRLKLDTWLSEVSTFGLATTRLRGGWHDEPLQGKRQNQRSIRLNKQWRAIYTTSNNVLILTVLEVTPHDYRTR